MSNDKITRIISSSSSSSSEYSSSTNHSSQMDCDSVLPHTDEVETGTNNSRSSTSSSRCEGSQTNVLQRLCSKYLVQQNMSSKTATDDNLKQPTPKRLTATVVSPFASNSMAACGSYTMMRLSPSSPLSKRPYTSAFVPFSPTTSTKQPGADHVVNVVSYDSCIELIETLSIATPREEVAELSSAEDEDREVKELNKREMKRRRGRSKKRVEDEDGTTASSSAVSTSSSSTAFYWMMLSPAAPTNLREGANLSLERWWMSAANNNQLYCSTTLPGEE